MSNHNRKRLAFFLVSVMLLVSVLDPAFTTFASAASPPSWTVDRPPYAGGTRTITYTTNTSSTNNDGIAAISLFAKPSEYRVIHPIENIPDSEPTEWVDLTVGVVANARQAMHRYALFYPNTYAWPYAPDGSEGWLWTSPDYVNDPSWGYESGPTGITGDNSGKWFQLSFPFQFYGVSYNWVWVSNDGYLSFESNYTSPTPPDFNGGVAPNGVIAGLWRHLDPSRSGTIRYYSGTWLWGGTQQVFVVTWENVMDVDTNTPQTFQIILLENGQNRQESDVYIQYESITTTTPTFVGLISPDASEAVSYPVDQLQTSKSYLRIPFLPWNLPSGASVNVPGTISHVWLSIGKAPGDNLAELDNPQCQAYNVVFDPNDLYNPIPLLEFGFNALVGACTFGANLAGVESGAVTAADLSVYKQTYDVVTSGMSLANTLFGLEMPSYVLDTVTGSYDFVTSQSFRGKLTSLYGLGRTMYSTIADSSSSDQGGWEQWLWALLNPVEGMTGFNDPTTNEANIGGIARIPGTLLDPVDIGLALHMVWKFNDVPDHVMDHKLTITAKIQYDYGYTGTDGLSHSATNYVQTSVVLTVISDVHDIPAFTYTPPDITGVETRTSYTLKWTATAIRPDYYVITRDGTQVAGGQNSHWSSGADITYTDSQSTPGTHTYNLTVYNTAGVSKSDSVMVTVDDHTPPVFLSYPGTKTFEKGTTGNTMYWQAGDHNTPGTYAITYYLAGHPDWWDYWGPNPSGTWTNSTQITIDVSSLGTGDWYFVCRVTDAYGNTASKSVLVKAILVPPTFTSTQQNINVEVGNTFTLRWTATDAAPNNYVITRGGTQVAGGYWSSGVSIPYTASLGSTGTYTYVITVYDKGGSYASSSALVTVFYDLTPPSFTSVPPRTLYVQVGQQFNLDWRAVDAKSHGGSYNINRGSVPMGSGTWTDNSLIRYTCYGIMTPGTYYYYCTVRDASGNQVTDTVKVIVTRIG